MPEINNDINLSKEELVNRNEHIAMRVSMICIVVNIGLSIGKIMAGIVGKSAAMVSDGVQSASDLVGTLISMAGVKVSNKPSDEDHQYGHERFECIASIILAVTLFMVAYEIGNTGYQKIWGNESASLEAPGFIALAAAVASIAIKEWMYWYTKKAADLTNSNALLAAAWDHRSDAFSSLGSFVGILGARMGYPVLDPIASLVICAIITYTGLKIVYESFERMTDHCAETEQVNSYIETIQAVPGVMHIDYVRTRIFGNRVYVDTEITIDDAQSFLEAHAIVEAVHHAVEEKFPEVKHCMVHANPDTEEIHDI